MFLGAEAMFFAGLIGAFLVFRIASPVWPPPFQPRLPSEVTGINTLILLASAVAMRLDLRLAPWNYKREFEALPNDYRNPYYMYMRRKDAQIRMPDALDRLRAAEVQRQLDRSMPAIKMAVAA